MSDAVRSALESETVGDPPSDENLVFGKYQIVRRLAVGGMGEIFLAKQLGGTISGFERLVVLKSLLPNLASDRVFIEQFLDEARVAASLSHPNIVSIYEVGEWRGNFMIALEYIAGIDLSKLLHICRNREMRVPVELIGRVIRDAARALHHAHTATTVDQRPLSIVHRDVSPSNIMVRLDGVTKVVDFGVAKAANRASRTSTGMLKGKFGYMSPEQVRMGELDHRSDQFSLGIVLWELLTGERLFQGLSEFMIFDRILHQDAPRPSTFVLDVPEELDELTARMLVRDRERRLENCAEVAETIERFAGDYGGLYTDDEVAEFLKPLVGDTISSATENLVGGPEVILELANRTDWSTDAKELVEPSSRPSRRPLAIALAVLLLAIVGGAATLWVAQQGSSPSLPNDRVTETPAEPSAPLAARIEISSEPTAATVEWDGEAVGETPIVLEGVKPGSHSLVLSKDGYAAVERPVETSGDDKELVITLEEDRKVLPARKPARKGTTRPRRPTSTTVATEDGALTIDTKPWSRVFINGTMQGVTPIFRLPLSPGVHKVRLVNQAQGIDTVRTVKIAGGQTTRISWRLER